MNEILSEILNDESGASPDYIYVYMYECVVLIFLRSLYYFLSIFLSVCLSFVFYLLMQETAALRRFTIDYSGSNAFLY